MRKRVICLFALLLAAMAPVGRSQETDRCAAALTETGRNELLRVKQQDREAYFYKKVCNSSSSDVALNFGVAKLSLGLGASSAREFCQNEKSKYESHDFDYLQTSTVVEKALQSWLSCIEMSTRGIRLTPERTRARLVLSLQRKGTAKGLIRGVSPTAGTTCKGVVKKKSRVLTDDTYFILPIDETWTITCDRVPLDSSVEPGAQIYPETTVTLDTSEGGFSITLPQEPVAKETWAQDILHRVTSLEDSLRLELESLRSSPGPGQYSSYSAAQGGAHAILRTADCPAGQVAVGIEMSLGGTCGRHCDPDGRPVHRFRLKCAPQFASER